MEKEEKGKGTINRFLSLLSFYDFIRRSFLIPHKSEKTRQGLVVNSIACMPVDCSRFYQLFNTDGDMKIVGEKDKKDRKYPEKSAIGKATNAIEPPSR